MPKRNSKSSNASSVVVVRSTALKMGAFSSSCSKLCNEWSFMSVRRAEAEPYVGSNEIGRALGGCGRALGRVTQRAITSS